MLSPLIAILKNDLIFSDSAFLGFSSFKIWLPESKVMMLKTMLFKSSRQFISTLLNKIIHLKVPFGKSQKKKKKNEHTISTFFHLHFICNVTLKLLLSRNRIYYP